MELIRYARAIGGLLSIATLLAVLLAHVLLESITVSMWVIAVLLSLIAALLGVDIAYEQIPTVNVSVENNGGDNSND